MPRLTLTAVGVLGVILLTTSTIRVHAQAGPSAAALGPSAAYNTFSTVPLRQTRSPGVTFDVQPSTAEVYVDGVYAGRVADFDGKHKRLTLPPGAYRIELRAPEYRSVRLSTRVQRRQTIEYRGLLARSASGVAD